MKERNSELLEEISSKLESLLSLLRIAFADEIEKAKERSFARSAIKKSIYDLCDGKHTVEDMSEEIGKEAAYIRVYLTTLVQEGLVVRKKDYYEAVV